MSKKGKAGIPTWGWIVGIVVLVLMWTVGSYNGLVSLKGGVDEAWAQVEVQYERRADLIPQLVATVKGSAEFERGTLEAVTEARTGWLNAAGASRGDQIAAAGAFDSALARLLVSVESYPTLTATEGFVTLQSQLEGTENRVAVARKDYNSAATTYNVKIKKIPTMFVANMFGFDASELFNASEGSEIAPEVQFDFSE